MLHWTAQLGAFQLIVAIWPAREEKPVEPESPRDVEAGFQLGIGLGLGEICLPPAALGGMSAPRWNFPFSNKFCGLRRVDQCAFRTSAQVV